MGKKKAPSKAGGRVASAERISVYNLKGSPEYRDWLNEISGHTLINTSVIIRDALAKWANERGLPSPPKV